MDLIKAIHDRHSVRAFEKREIPREIIQTLVEAAAAAPSAGNTQPWRLHIATGDARDRVNEVMALSTVHLSEYLDIVGPEVIAHAEEFYANLGGAPIVMAVSLPPAENELDRLNEYLSAGAAIQNVLLAATDAGVGSCNITFSFWVRDQLLDVFEVDEDREIVSLVLLGYPGEEPVAPQHREDIATILE